MRSSRRKDTAARTPECTRKPQPANKCGQMRELQIYLSVTERCNLSCSFCYQREFDKSQPFLAQAVCKAATNLIGTGQATVVFYGGEPTLYPSRILRVIEQLGTNPRVNFGLQSNGTRLSQVMRYADRLSFLSVSVNEENIDLIDRRAIARMKAKVPTIGRFTYTGGDLASLISNSAGLFTHVYWQVVNGSAWQFTVQDYRRQLLELVTLANRLTRGSGEPRFIPFEHVASALRRPSHSLSPLCGFGTHLRYIDPSGNVFYCDELAQRSPPVDIAALMDAVCSLCESCSIRSLCRSRCPATLAKFGADAFSAYCRLTRVLTETVASAYGEPRGPCDEPFSYTEVIP
jgi:sulfatase maturation enzyme AslB (radical SAM superfamily)